ncbi:MAG: hypothetical protein VB070_01655 [Clostridiaceae bacterium]|nr:hypothetical protein [Clostridiaceae bacterium]
MNLNRSAFYNLILGALKMLLSGILSMICTRVIMLSYGSDFNGVNSTAAQFVSLLLIVEGGFTLATNVALLKPIAEHDVEYINGILAATHRKFKTVALLFLTIGVSGSFFYSMIINSDLPRSLIFSIFTMLIIPYVVDFLFSAHYKALLQSVQKEYLINLVSLISTTISYSVTIIVAYNQCPMWMIRFVSMLCSTIANLCFVLYCKKRFKKLNLNVEPNYHAISGSKDVLIAQIGWTTYSSMPLLLISAMASEGTLVASVYAVYNSIVSIIKSLLTSISDAPRFGLGMLINNDEKDHAYKTFLEYQLIVIGLSGFLLSVTLSLIIPFVKLYTSGVTDIDYVNYFIPVALIMNAFSQYGHIPSGQIIQMSGHFRLIRNIQLTKCIIMIPTFAIGAIFGGIYGILLAYIACEVYVFFREIYFCYSKYFKRPIKNFIFQYIPNFLLMSALSVAGINIIPQMQNYLHFVLWGIILVLVYGLLFLGLNLILHREIVVNTARRIKQLFKVNVKS